MDLFDHPPTASELQELFSYKPQEALTKSYQGHDYLMWFWKEAPDMAATVYFIGYMESRASKMDWPAIVGELISMKSPLETFVTLGRSLNKGLSHLDGLNTKPLLFQVLLYALQEKDQFTTTRRDTEIYKNQLIELVDTFSSFEGSLSYTQNGAQALHLLMSTKYKDIVGQVLSKMDDSIVNERVSSRNNTWAHEAVIAKSTPALQWFAQHHPDIFDMRNNDGQTPAQLAEDMQCHNLVRHMKPVAEKTAAVSVSSRNTSNDKGSRAAQDDQYSLF